MFPVWSADPFRHLRPCPPHGQRLSGGVERLRGDLPTLDCVDGDDPLEPLAPGCFIAVWLFPATSQGKKQETAPLTHQVKPAVGRHIAAVDALDYGPCCAAATELLGVASTCGTDL